MCIDYSRRVVIFFFFKQKTAYEMRISDWSSDVCSSNLMTNPHKDALFVLVNSLSKSEKRQFKLYVGRLGVNTDAKFLALFNLLDKFKEIGRASCRERVCQSV